MFLGISTSQSQISIVLGKDGIVLYERELALSANSGNDLGAMVREALAGVGIDVKGVNGIITDIGPGGTSSVRTGVAFANGLAYCLDIPVIPVTSIELIGMDVFDRFQLPVVTIIPSIRQHYYCGFYDGSSIVLHYGKPEALAALIDEAYKEVVIAGYGKLLAALPELLKSTKIVYSEVQKVNARLMITKLPLFDGYAVKYPNLPVPVTESSM